MVKNEHWKHKTTIDRGQHHEHAHFSVETSPLPCRLGICRHAAKNISRAEFGRKM